jgi:hypothetical protein
MMGLNYACSVNQNFKKKKQNLYILMGLSLSIFGN